MKIALAEALLRRKELNGKVAQLAAIKQADCLRTVVQRRSVTEQVDDIVATVPLVPMSQLTREYDYYAKHLRLVDAHIQRANWSTELDIDGASMEDYVAPEKIPDDRVN